MPQHDRRSTDTQLILLQEKVDNHIQEFHTHRKEYQAYREEESERWERLLTSQEEFAKGQAANTEAIHELAESSRDLLSAWQAATGTVKLLSALGKFVKWLSGFAVVGAFLTWLAQHFGTK